jgi:hypothetical protein
MTKLIKMIQELSDEAKVLGFSVKVTLSTHEATATVVPNEPEDDDEEEEEEVKPKKKAAAKKKPAAKKPAAKKKKPEPVEEEEEEDDEEEEGVTFEDVGDRIRLACKEYVKGDVSAFLKDYGVKRASDLTEDQYEDFYSQLDEEFPSE